LFDQNQRTTKEIQFLTRKNVSEKPSVLLEKNVGRGQIVSFYA